MALICNTRLPQPKSPTVGAIMSLRP
jgi:hypothetical protein